MAALAIDGLLLFMVGTVSRNGKMHKAAHSLISGVLEEKLMSLDLDMLVKMLRIKMNDFCLKKQHCT